MPLENFENYFKGTKEDAQEEMSEFLAKKEEHATSRHAIYQEFETIQTAIDTLNSEIDELVRHQNKPGVPVTIAQKHGELTIYEDRLEDLLAKYPKMKDMEPSLIDSIRKKLAERKEVLESLQGIDPTESRISDRQN